MAGRGKVYNKNDKYKQAEKKVAYTKEKEHVKDILAYPFADLTHRGIRKEICQMYNVRMAVSEKDGKTPEAVYFPYYSKQKKISGWKKKDFTLDKNDNYYITTIGTVGTACLLFGQYEAEKIERKHNKLFYVEGEEDVLASVQACLDTFKGTKFEGLQPFVVGLSCGCANAQESTIQNLDFIKTFDNVHLAFDSDFATDKEFAKGVRKGREATQAVGTTLLSDNIWVVDYPEGIKDPNDLLEQKKYKTLANLLSFPTRKFSAEKIVKASDISIDEVLEEKPWGVVIEAFPKLMAKLRGFRKSELTILTAPVNAGKSTIMSEIAYGIAQAGFKVGMIFLEETRKETYQRLMARHLKVNYNLFKFNPRQYAPQNQLQDAYNWVKEGDKFTFVDHFGSLPIEKLMSIIKSLYYIDKVDYILLDHLTLVISGLAVADDRKMLDLTMTELASFCAAHDIGVIAVSHLNRDVTSEMKGKDKDEPFWINVRKEQLRGSSSLEALAWTVIGMDVEILPNKERGRVRLTSLKNRPTSRLGEADILMMDETTGLLMDASD